MNQAFRSALQRAAQTRGDAGEIEQVTNIVSAPQLAMAAPGIGMSYEDYASREVARTYWAERRPVAYRIWSRWGFFDNVNWEAIIAWITENLPKILQVLASILVFI